MEIDESNGYGKMSSNLNYFLSDDLLACKYFRAAFIFSHSLLTCTNEDGPVGLD